MRQPTLTLIIKHGAINQRFRVHPVQSELSVRIILGRAVHPEEGVLEGLHAENVVVVLPAPDGIMTNRSIHDVLTREDTQKRLASRADRPLVTHAILLRTRCSLAGFQLLQFKIGV